MQETKIFHSGDFLGKTGIFYAAVVKEHLSECTTSHRCLHSNRPPAAGADAAEAHSSRTPVVWSRIGTVAEIFSKVR